jgi:starch synthase
MTLRVLAVASEAVPLVKTGGLADVVGALPAALAPEGIAVTTLLPLYPAVRDAVPRPRTLRRIAALYGGPARLLAAEVSGMRLLLLDVPHLYDRPGGPYLGPDGLDWPDNALRFAALGRVAADVARTATGRARIDAVHAHDWQAGLVGAYLRHGPGRRVPVLFSIHNLAFQGRFPAALFPALGLPAEAFSVEGVEYGGGVGFLKAGIWYADRITTVSPSYAAEIMTPEGGMGLDGLLRGRADALSGILNGLDTSLWDPSADPLLPAPFSAADLAPRAAAKAALRSAFGLAADPEAPLFAFIGRLAWQKGVDLLLDALPALLGAGGQLALLGSGEPALQQACLDAAAANPGRVGARIAFREDLAHLLYAGADCVIVPSRFEPCGLTQLCALRYGAPPLVARAGGLADTVVDANDAALAAGVATGLMVPPGSVPGLAAGILRAAALWRDRPAWARMQANAMASDLSWGRSAGRYAALFREVASQPP